MSLMSAILAFAPALAARVKSAEETSVDDKAHPRFLAGYDAGIKDGGRVLQAMGAELDRVRRQRDAAREELCRRLADQPLYRQMALPPRQAYYQSLASAGMPSAQAYPEMFCTCTPSRYQALAGAKWE